MSASCGGPYPCEFQNSNNWGNNPAKGPNKFDSSTILQGCRINISPKCAARLQDWNWKNSKKLRANSVIALNPSTHGLRHTGIGETGHVARDWCAALEMYGGCRVYCRVLCQCTCIECVWLQLLAFAGSYVVSYVSVCHCLMSVYYVRGTQLLFPFITSNCAVTSETSCRSWKRASNAFCATRSCSTSLTSTGITPCSTQDRRTRSRSFHT